MYPPSWVRPGSDCCKVLFVTGRDSYKINAL
jgi:hypothetical protein